MPTIRNEAEFLTAMNAAVLRAINRTADKALLRLQDNAEKYATGQVSDWYEPTGEFVSAWDWIPVPGNLNEQVRKIFYDWQTMSSDYDLWQHHSQVKGWGDSRQYLDDILNKQGFTSSLEWKMTQPYWDITMRELFDARFLEDWFRRFLFEETHMFSL